MPAVSSSDIATSLPNVPSTRRESVANACNTAATGQVYAGSDVLATLALFGWWYPLTEATAAFSDAAGTVACTNGDGIQVQKSWIAQNDLTQSTSSKRPVFNSSSGAAFVRSSSQSLEIANSLITGTTFCLFVLGKPFDLTSAGLFAKIGNGSTGFGLGVGGIDGDTDGNKLLGLREALAWVDSGTTIGFNPVVLGYSHNGTNGSYYKKTALISSLTGQTINAPTGTFGIGGHDNSHYLDGTVYDVLVGAFNPTTTQAAQVNGFLRSLRGLNVASYNAGFDTVTLGGTESSPDTLDSIVAAVGNTAKASKVGAYSYFFSFATLNGADGFLEFAPDTVSVFTSTQWDRNGATGGAIFRERSVVRHEGTGYFLSSVAANTGYKFIAYRDLEGVNPRYISAANSRYDFLTSNDFPIETPTFIITGLDLETIGTNGSPDVAASLKLFFSVSSSISNLRVLSRSTKVCEFQARSGIYEDLTLEGSGVATSADAGLTITLNRPVFNFKGVVSPLSFNFNNTAIVEVRDPTFPNGAWSGSYEGFASGFRNDAGCVVNVSYTSKLTLLNGATPVQAKVRHTRNDAVNIDVTANGSGLVSQLLLTSTRNGAGFGFNAQTGGASATYTWSIRARKYDRKVAGATDDLYSAQAFSAATNLPVQMVVVPFLPLSEAAAGTLAGISIIAAGSTSGTITLTANRTVVEVWQYYRQWIATFVNFGSNDTWDYDGSMLDFGAWNIAVNGCTLTGNIALAATLTLDATGLLASTASLFKAGSTIVVDSDQDFQGSMFDPIVTINRTSGTTRTVTVDGNQITNITAGAGVTLQFPAKTLTISGFVAGSDVLLSQAGIKLTRLNETSPPFVWSISGITIPGIIQLTITKAGYETYLQAIPLSGSDVSITVAQILENSSDTYDSAQVEFKTLMLGDVGFRRILAAATGSLADEAASCRLAGFESTAVKASWNTIVASVTPTAPEIVVWQGYLVASGYTTIAFANVTGEIS